jgi:hypothetical protein
MLIIVPVWPSPPALLAKLRSATLGSRHGNGNRSRKIDRPYVMPRRKPSAGSVPGFHNAYAKPNGVLAQGGCTEAPNSGKG